MRTVRLIVALGIVLGCVAAAVMSVTPPPTMLLVIVAALADELSPLIAAAALGAIPVVWWMLPRETTRRTRLAAAALLTVVAVVESMPVIAAHRVARAASVKFAYSPRHALLGDANRALVTTRAISYTATDGAPLRMLLFRGEAVGPRPGMVVLYGGAWRGGEPEQAYDVSRYFARRGYTVAAIDYRHAPEHPHPAQIRDVRRSLALLRDSADAWGIDTGRVSFVGRSAGGHLALLAAFAPYAGDDRALRAASVVAFYAPFDLAAAYHDLPNPDPIGVRDVLRNFTGGTPENAAEVYRDASPSTYVRSGVPPTLLIYASHDHLVMPRFGRQAAAALRASGSPVQYVEMTWAEHGFDLVPNGVGNQLSLRLLEKFLRETLQ